MEQLSKQAESGRRRSSPGLTVVELMVVVGIITILSAIALPNFMQWRNNITYRETARDMVNLLRRAKSDAITYNRENRVEIDPVPGRYYMRRGNSSANVIWTDYVLIPIPAEIIIVPSAVRIVPSPPAIETARLDILFRPNGTVEPSATVQVRDTTGAPRYWVDIAQSGRIRACSSGPCP
jgi:Tfp pilus assembly protein FimT